MGSGASASFSAPTNDEELTVAYLSYLVQSPDVRAELRAALEQPVKEPAEVRAGVGDSSPPIHQNSWAMPFRNSARIGF